MNLSQKLSVGMIVSLVIMFVGLLIGIANGAPADSRPTWLFFTSSTCGPCRQSVAIHKLPRVRAWMKKFRCVTVDVQQQPAIAKQYGVTRTPTDIFVSADKTPRVFRPKGRPATENLYAWRFAHAYQALVDEDFNGGRMLVVKAEPSYPLRPATAVKWYGCKDWRHLLTREHAGKFDAGWLSRRTDAEIQSLHADDHENKVQWKFVVRPSPQAARQ